MTKPEDIRRAANISVSNFEARIQAGDFANPSGTEAREALIAEFERAILAAEKRGERRVCSVCTPRIQYSGGSLANCGYPSPPPSAKGGEDA